MQSQDTLFDPIEYTKRCIEKKVEEALPPEILYATVDMKKLIDITSHSDTYLRKHFINTPEAKALSCSPTSKELWKYPDIRDCWLDFCDRMKKRKKL